jgi:Niemann-Pick C1 protein
VFILFGLGVDDMFLLVDAYDRFHATTDLTLRCAEACREVGSSILYTSLTTFIALLVGSTIDLPAVQSFCITTAVAVLFVFAITLFMFMPLLVLNERRIAANRYDLVPCIKSSRVQVKTEARAASVANRVEQSKVVLRPEATLVHTLATTVSLIVRG